MAQDTALLRYLLKGARRAPGSGSQRDLAFAFDGTNDYISSNATIGRTGYDMNVSGNVSTGSDADGSYIWINGNRNAGVGTGAGASISSGVVFNQGTSFSIGGKFKVNSYASTTVSGLFGSNFDAGIHHTTTNSLVFGLRGSTTVQNTYATAFTLGTSFYVHLTYDATTARFYCYINGALQNVGGTAGPATFSTLDWILGDGAITGGTQESSNKFAYHAAIRNKALTQAEIDADIALGNTIKNDPSIVAYYIPENLTYNTQYMLNSSDFSNVSWTKTNTTVTADTTVAPDGTTTADTLTIGTGATSGVTQISTVVSGATIASKTFIVKAFIRVAAGTSKFRLIMYQNGVATGTSADLTATTTWQEFTFTQTFTSSTTATGITGGIINESTGLTTPVLLAWKCRVYLVNETLRDESPNIGGFLGWKQNEVISARIKPSADATGSTGDTQCFMLSPYYYGHLRTTSNNIQIRADTRLAAIGAAYTLGNGFRSKAHILGIRMWDGTKFLNKLYLNGTLVNTANGTEQAPISSGNYGTNFWMGRKGSTYFSGNIRDARIYTFTGSFTNADALAIYNGGEPTSSGITKYLHYRPPVGEVGTTTQDQSTNDRDGTLNNGVTRNYI